MALDVMQTRNTKSKPHRTEELADGLHWVGLIFAAMLALVVAIQSTPSIRDATSGEPAAATAE